MTVIENIKLPAHSPLRPDFIPPSDYSAEFHRLEMERLWPRAWQIACREEEIPNPGDYVNYEIGKESILVIRNAAGSIKAFYNVCPHRGRRLRDDARGHLTKLFCGYHAWTFDLDGKPVSIPSEEDWKGCPQASREDLSLSPVKAGTWAGFVWINMDPACEPLHKFLGPLPEELDPYRWDECRMRSYQTLIFPINWKVALEAFVEGYHLSGTHPQLLRFGVPHLPGVSEFMRPGQLHAPHLGHRSYEFNEKSEFKNARDYVYEDFLTIYNTLHGLIHDEGARATERVRSEIPADMPLMEIYAKYGAFLKEEYAKSGVTLPDLSKVRQGVTEWQIFPNCSVLPTPEGAFWYRSRPNGDDPNSTIFDIWSLGRFAPGKEPKVEHEIYRRLEDFKGKNPILEQDFSNMIAVHKGTQSRGWKGARPSPSQESNVYNLHRVLHEFMLGEAK
jgi:phenylpropionate dioxygenase-like ring-hydroxylating dioxygenase large terminal subunit